MIMLCQSKIFASIFVHTPHMHWINKPRLSFSLLTIFALSNEALPESGDQALALASAALDVDKNEKRKS